MENFLKKEKGSEKPEEKTEIYPEGIINYEEKFSRKKKDADKILYEIDEKQSYTFPLNKIKPEGKTDYFYPVEESKSLIVLHFSVGFLTGDIASLTEQGSRASTPYLIARDGIVYQLFEPQFWGNQLGRGAIGGNVYNSKRGIGIELSNIGPLIRENGDLLNVFGKKYCTIEEEDFYTKLEIPFRKYTYFATFTEVQYDSLRELLAYLCAKFNIPHEILPENKRYRLFPSKNEAQTFRGICSHINFRGYGELDLGPAFYWGKLFN